MINQVAKKWNIKKPRPSKRVVEDYGLIVASLLYNRGVLDVEKINQFLNPNFSALPDPFQMPGIKDALEVIKKTIDEGKKICIYGDYDVDGISSTALLLSFFKKINVNCFYYLPSREKEGYGLSVEAIDKLYKKNVKLIITVDCGITAIKEVEHAKIKGIDVIITDHHEVPDLLPNAVVIHPGLKESKYPYKNLAGVGVVFKLIQVLANHFLDKPEEFIKWSLDLVALGTIADVVPLTGENRILTFYGLIVLSKTKRLGLNILMSCASLKKSEIDSLKVGFCICPRLNATGRISDASKGLDLLLAKEEILAKELTDEITRLNNKRQKITENILTDVLNIIEKENNKNKFLLLSSTGWPSGVIGIVASRVVDKLHKPVILFEEKDDLLHGSARSIDQIDIVSYLEKCKEYLIKFGGHKMAAGMVLEKDKFNDLYTKLEYLATDLDESLFCPQLEVDLSLNIEEINLELFNNINKLKPFGSGNPEPVFVTHNCVIVERKMIGSGNIHVKWTVEDEFGKRVEALGFGMNQIDINIGDKVSLVFKLHINDWNGKKKIELKVIDICKKN